jgi:hypothetical protein
MVENQIFTLIPALSFGHNLCCKYSNGSCKLILNIYIWRAFQWYKDVFNPMNFDPSNCSLKIRNSIKIPTPKWQSTWECVGSFPHIFSHSRECECDFQIPLSIRTFPCHCLGHEPKVRVKTLHVSLSCFIYKINYKKCGKGSILKNAMFECDDHLQTTHDPLNSTT